MSDHEFDDCQSRWHDELAAYALEALPAEEAEALERHLAGCESCSDRLLLVAARGRPVPASVSQIEPPAGLRQSLMETVRAEDPALAAGPGTGRGAPRRRAAGCAQPSLPLAPAESAEPRPDAPGSGRLRGARDALRRASVATCSAAAAMTTQTFAVKPLTEDVAATGELQIADGKGTLVMDNLPPLDKGEVYQLWTSSGAAVEPSSVFVSETGGHATAAIPDVPQGTSRVLITREPAGGSRQPHGDAVLAANLD